MTRWPLARIAASLIAVALTLSACATTPIAGTRPSGSAPPSVVYAAVGASETYGIGASDRYRQAWPQVFYNDVLPRSAVLYNFGIPGATTAQALHDEVPAAVAVHPTVATVWLNVNDLINGVAVGDYEIQLRQVLHACAGVARPGCWWRTRLTSPSSLRSLPVCRTRPRVDPHA